MILDVDAAVAQREEEVGIEQPEVERTYSQDYIERISLGIQELLSLCAEKNVEVPERLKQCLLDSLEEHRLHSQQEYLCSQRKECNKARENDLAFQLQEILKKLKATLPVVNVRVKNGSYTVRNVVSEDIEPFKSKHDDDSTGPRRAKQKIKTVKTESPFYKLIQCFLKCIVKGEVGVKKQEKVIMDGVNLYLESGKMYLVLGAPGSGKSTLLKMIANNLYTSPDHVAEGEVSISGISPSKDVVWTNLAGYIDQIDRLHPFLTVYETCEFAWQCRSGGTHRKPMYGEGPEVDELIAKFDLERMTINKVLEGLGLARVKDTFVGDQLKVRGVSGGEKKRVTVAEMLVTGVPVLCCDEISTGLDAATTFDITRLMGSILKVTSTLKIVSLLQPPPETVANFDELILLSDGKIIYCGPVEFVIPHFNELGYEVPERMDVADWLQALPTKDGWQYLKGVDPETAKQKHLSTDEFHKKFYESVLGRAILAKLESPLEVPDPVLQSMASVKFMNTTLTSLKLLVRRELLLWWRDKYQIKAKIGQVTIMGTIVGTLFFQSSDQYSNIISVLFQSLMFTLVGAMTLVVKQFPARGMLYKQQDANFFPVWTYVAGRSVAAIPNALIDGIGYGTMIYFLVGLAYNDGASIANYFIFVLLLIITSLTSGLFFGIFSASLQTLSAAQASMSIVACLFIIFSGFTVQPDVIPNYYIWLYYINYAAWGLRGLVINEFDSGKYDNIPTQGNPENMTQGNILLTQFGFTDRDDEPYSSLWTWWGILFELASAMVAVFLTAFFLTNIRYATGRSLMTDKGDEELEELSEDDMVELPFKRVDLTFKDIHYTVQSSITKESLELLKGVDGVIEAGKMTALMGSSGAGKTTLMDVLAMRKSTGELTGQICLNGHPQEDISFRRCTGYVEQFDVQSPQLTIRETVQFSANLRLDDKDPAVTETSKRQFVNQTLHMLELTNLQDLQVGSDEEGGLSFEQRKRLSIAVELVCNPSILFLDEPTSGLDARAAAIVMSGMQKIAASGRAVCATIHQPSVAIFNQFDSLLLLKRGGEVVFHGELGENSSKLIQYFERFDATPRINPGENPATWMLTCIGAGSAKTVSPFDYAAFYSQSDLRSQCLEKIDRICAKPTPEGKVSFDSRFATSGFTQAVKVLLRTMKIYYRSPNYNVTRVLVSAVVALLFGSVYASQRVPENESDMNSRLNSVFVALIFLCVNAMNSVLSVFEFERNMFYRHRAAGMYQSSAMARAFTLAELPFIFVSAVVFCVMFYFIMGFSTDVGKFFIFFLFTFLAFATYTFAGQMFVSLFRDGETAQGIGGLLVMMTSLFCGILIRPGQIPPFWIFMYWITPGHYIFEPIFMSQFDGDMTLIEASPGSPFFYSIPECVQGQDPCYGTADQWIQVSFPDWSVDNIPYDGIYFVVLIVMTRVVTLFALMTLDYRSN